MGLEGSFLTPLAPYCRLQNEVREAGRYSELVLCWSRVGFLDDEAGNISERLTGAMTFRVRFARVWRCLRKFNNPTYM